MISLQEAVDDLYRVAVAADRRRSPNRLTVLADMCVEQLARRNIAGVAKEHPVRGIGRSKYWDLAWPPDGKARLGSGETSA